MIYFGMADIGGAIIMFGVTYFVGSYFSSAGDSFDFKYLGKLAQISATYDLYHNVYFKYA